LDFFTVCPALLKAAEVSQPLLQGAEGGVVHGAVELFAVAGDEGDGIALVQQLNHVGHVLGGFVQFLGELFDDRVHRSFLSGRNVFLENA